MRTFDTRLRFGRTDAPRPSGRRWLRPLVLAGAVLTLLAGSAAPATAHGGGGGGGPLAEGLVAPLAIDVTHRGEVLVSQSFAGVATKVGRDGTRTDLFAEPGLAAIGEGPFGTVLYTVLGEDGRSLLKVRFPWGATKELADLGAHEANENPDQGNQYGVVGISDECAAEWPVEDLGPPQYSGIVESNPYKMEVTLWGVYVADSAANAIWFVDWSGRVHTVAVLPPQPLRIPDDPAPLGLPACVGGLTYNFEAVPTDIELGWGGAYVSLLPGGPEDPSLGARGSVVKINPFTGSVRPYASGFLGATDLAVSPWGEVYVTELFGGRVSKATRSGPVTVAELPGPTAVEWAQGRLYVAYGFDFAAPENGALTTIRA